MKPKEIFTIERERKAKQFWDETKKWSFEDFKEYLKEKRKRSNLNALGALALILLLLAFLFSFAYVPLYEKYLERGKVLIAEAENQCAQINQTFFQLELLGDSALIKCSESNTLIGGRR